MMAPSRIPPLMAPRFVVPFTPRASAVAAVAPAGVNSYKLELLSPTKILPVPPTSTTGAARKLDPWVTVAPVRVHPVVALGIVAAKVIWVALAEAGICTPLMAATSPAVQPLPVLAVTPAMVTNSPILSVLATVTVTTVAVAVTAVGVADAGVALTCTGKFPPAYAGVPLNVGVIAYRKPLLSPT